MDEKGFQDAMVVLKCIGILFGGWVVFRILVFMRNLYRLGLANIFRKVSVKAEAFAVAWECMKGLPDAIREAKERKSIAP